MNDNNILDKNKHYSRGRDIEPISGMIVDTSYSLKYRNELSRMVAKEYLLNRFKELYGNLNLKEDEELDKLYDIQIQTRDKIISLTRQGYTLDNISRIKNMPSYIQIKEMITSDSEFAFAYTNACAEGSVFLVDEIETITKDFIKGVSEPHIDAVGLNSVVKSLAIVARMKNPERYGENAKTINNYNNNQINNNIHTPQEIKMILEGTICEIDDKNILRNIILKAQETLDNIIAKEIMQITIEND